MSAYYCSGIYWPGGRVKAVTLSYDDGVEQDIRLISMLNRYGIKATFNLNPGLFGIHGTVTAGEKEVPHNKIAAERIAEVYQGHEIAAHGDMHLPLLNADLPHCIMEILQSRIKLEQLLKHPVTGYAYAYGDCSGTIIQAAESSGIRYARTVISTHTFEVPSDLLKWNPTCHHNDIRLKEHIADFLSDGYSRSRNNPARLLYIWGHAYEFDQDENWEHAEQILEILSGRQDIWYATNGEIAEYILAYRNLIFTADSAYVFNPGAVPVWVGCFPTQSSVCVRPGETVQLLPPEIH